jgi:hypothetical protein
MTTPLISTDRQHHQNYLHQGTTQKAPVNEHYHAHDHNADLSWPLERKRTDRFRSLNKIEPRVSLNNSTTAQ